MMAWNEQDRYDINENEVLSVWNTGTAYVVRVDDTVNSSAYILHTTNNKEEAIRLFEMFKAAYEELIY